MGTLSWWHWLIIIAAFVVIFGYKRLPDAARGVGRSLRILKSEVAAMHEDDEKAKKPAETDATAASADAGAADRPKSGGSGHAATGTPPDDDVGARRGAQGLIATIQSYSGWYQHRCPGSSSRGVVALSGCSINHGTVRACGERRPRGRG